MLAAHGGPSLPSRARAARRRARTCSSRVRRTSAWRRRLSSARHLPEQTRWRRL